MFWLVFVGLKLAELAALVFVPWWVGHLIFRDEDKIVAKWGMGLLVIAATVGVLCVLVGLGGPLLQMNLEWAQSIVGGA